MTKRKEVQLDLIEKTPARGGAREGAGRKPKRPTKVLRVPDAYAGAIEALIAHLDETSDIGRHHQAVDSEQMFFRSQKGKPQWLSFRIAPKV